MRVSTPHRIAAVVSGTLAAAISHFTGHPPPGVVLLVGVVVCGAYVAGLVLGDAAPHLVSHLRHLPRRRTAFLATCSIGLAVLTVVIAGEVTLRAVLEAVTALFAPFLLDLALAAHQRESGPRTAVPEPPASPAASEPARSTRV
ncbi:hypothetical protein [Sphaerisporangium dianthi]|uniref:Uncharacterized protein n=1 Tax=Sphaerisporangium dianthi TaxID=1436120 RepID=A0ABV9CE42_9ACTN